MDRDALNWPRDTREREVWSQTSVGWVREQLGPPDIGGYPRPGIELRAIERFVSLSGREIIEIGCGDGRLTFQYAPRARRVVALDPNAAEIERARAEAHRIGARNIRFWRAGGGGTGAHFDVAMLRGRYDARRKHGDASTLVRRAFGRGVWYSNSERATYLPTIASGLAGTRVIGVLAGSREDVISG